VFVRVVNGYPMNGQIYIDDSDLYKHNFSYKKVGDFMDGGKVFQNLCIASLNFQRINRGLEENFAIKEVRLNERERVPHYA